MVSIIAKPTNKRPRYRAGGLRLAGDGIHGGGDRAAFAERRTDGAERYRHRRGEDADDLDVVHDAFPFLSCRRRLFADGAADKDHGQHREYVGLDGAGQQIERHQRDRYQQAGQRKNDADDENAAHHVAEQAHHQRERAGEGFDDIERNHEDRRLGKGLQVTADAARADAEVDDGEEHDQRLARRRSRCEPSAGRFREPMMTSLPSG